MPADVLSALEADGVPMQPKPSALRFAQDKLAMRERLEGLGVPCPAWRAVVDVDELAAICGKKSLQFFLNTPT
ncbi:5-(carboxyamino)imidazole ribonucleotide synthase, partial [Dermacoccus abyssi]